MSVAEELRGLVETARKSPVQIPRGLLKKMREAAKDRFLECVWPEKLSKDLIEELKCQGLYVLKHSEDCYRISWSL